MPLGNQDSPVRVQPAVRAPDGRASLGVPRPGVGAAVRDPHVDRPELADLEPGFEFERLDHRLVRAGFDGSPAPMAVALGERHDRNVADRALRHCAGRHDGAHRFRILLEMEAGGRRAYSSGRYARRLREPPPGASSPGRRTSYLSPSIGAPRHRPSGRPGGRAAPRRTGRGASARRSSAAIR